MIVLRRSILAAFVASLLVLGASGVTHDAGAQRPGRGKPGGRGAARMEKEEQRDDRPALQREVRKAFAQAVRRRLNLNDDQMRQLQQVNSKYDVQRRQLLRSERQTRQGLAAAMRDSTIPDKERQQKVSQYMDQLVQYSRQRADLLDGEQKDLAGFLSPMQRAQYSAMRDRFNRRLQEIEQDSTAAGGRGGPPPPPAQPPAPPLPLER